MSASMLVFEVRGSEKPYAIDVERVLNVIEPNVMTPVPLLPGSRNREPSRPHRDRR